MTSAQANFWIRSLRRFQEPLGFGGNLGVWCLVQLGGMAQPGAEVKLSGGNWAPAFGAKKNKPAKWQVSGAEGCFLHPNPSENEELKRLLFAREVATPQSCKVGLGPDRNSRGVCTHAHIHTHAYFAAAASCPAPSCSAFFFCAGSWETAFFS